MPIQIVGTPAVIVTFCSASPSSSVTGIQVRAREDLLDARHRAREGEAPRVRVEHRDDRKADVVRRDPEARVDRQRVDRDRAVRVEDALRAAGGAARVTHRRRRALGEVPVRELRLVGVREQVLVVDRAVGRGPVSGRDHVLEGAARDELLGERPQDLVDDEHPVAAVRGDVGVVVGVEAEVQRVRHEPARRRTDVGLEVLRVVPHERPDAVAVLEPELAERDDEPLRARDEVRIRVPVPALVGQPADDLAVAVELVRAAQDRGHVQLVVHHQAVHGLLSLLESMRRSPGLSVGPGRSPSSSEAAISARRRVAGRAEALDRERALVQPVEPVLPREADAAEGLDRRLADPDRALARVRLRGRGGDRRLRISGRDAPGRPERERARELDARVRVRERVGDGLVDADLLSELLARRGVLDRVLECEPRDPGCLERERRLRARLDLRRGRPSRTGAGPARRRGRRRAAVRSRSSRAPRARRPRARRCRRRRRSRRARRCRGRGRAGRTRASSSSRRRPPRRAAPGGVPAASIRSSRSTVRGRARARAPRRARPPRRTRGRRRRPPPRPRRLSSRARRAAPTSAPDSRRGTRVPARGARPARE